MAPKYKSSGSSGVQLKKNNDRSQGWMDISAVWGVVRPDTVKHRGYF